MPQLKFEYIWLDGHKPEQNLRSKTKVISMDAFDGNVKELPEWSFDGSSTMQAEGHHSDCILKPVQVYPDASRLNGYLVMCEVFNPDGTPHVTNTRCMYEDNPDFWYGFEQEYTFTFEGRPLGFPEHGYPRPQGPYYCAVGKANVSGRDIVEEHLDLCLDAGIGITGINAEVMLGQWEFQVFGAGKKAADDLHICRFLLHRVTEKYDLDVNFHPKPIQGDWNGSGLHTNFSSKHMREVGGKEYIQSILDTLEKNHLDHIKEYGSSNELRLTGLHETQHIGTFSYGESDRGASIRIPLPMVANNWKGYLEDRRPASNACPYRISSRIQKTYDEAKLN